MVVASDKYGLYGLPLEKAEQGMQSEFAQSKEAVYELTVPTRKMIDPIESEIDNIRLWKYNPVATVEGFYLILDEAQSVSVRKWAITECAVPRSVLARIGMAFGKAAPATKKSAGEYAKGLFRLTDEEAKMVDATYTSEQKKWGDDYTAENFFVPPERVGFKHEWMTEEWFKTIGDCWGASERAEVEREAARVLECLDTKRSRGPNKNHWVRLNPMEGHSYIYIYKDNLHSRIRVHVWSNSSNSFACKSFLFGGPISEREAESQATQWRDKKKQEFGYVLGKPPVVEGRVKEKTTDVAKGTKQVATRQKRTKKQELKDEFSDERKKHDDKTAQQDAESNTGRTSQTAQFLESLEARLQKRKELEMKEASRGAEQRPKAAKQAAQRKLHAQPSDVSSYSMNPAEPGLPFDFLNQSSEDDLDDSETKSLPVRANALSETQDSEAVTMQESQEEQSVEQEFSESESGWESVNTGWTHRQDSLSGSESQTVTDAELHNFGHVVSGELNKEELDGDHVTLCSRCTVLQINSLFQIC